jgi:hypothetical protein
LPPPEWPPPPFDPPLLFDPPPLEWLLLLFDPPLLELLFERLLDRLLDWLELLLVRLLDDLAVPPLDLLDPPATRLPVDRLVVPLLDLAVPPVPLVDRLLVEVEGRAAEGLLVPRVPDAVPDLRAVPELRDERELLVVPDAFELPALLAVPEDWSVRLASDF